MRLAIISDTHDNLATSAKFLDFIGRNPVQTIIHCGDIASGETLEYLAARFGGRILAVLGNMDYENSVLGAAKKLGDKAAVWKNFGQAEFDGSKIGFCHHKETGLKYMEIEYQKSRACAESKANREDARSRIARYGDKRRNDSTRESAKSEGFNSGVSNCKRANSGFDFIFYGHTHKPWRETINGCQFANPGNLAGMIYKATFAVLDTKTNKLELKIIDRL